MSEKIIWKGNPSHYECIGGHSIAVLLAIPTIGLSLLYSVYLYFKITTTEYMLTEKTIIRKSGILSRKTDELMLYRIQDTSLDEPFWMRFVKLSNIKIYSTDRSDSEFYLTSVKNGDKLRLKIRNLSEELKGKMGIRPMDVNRSYHPDDPN
jgi:uncharacterized membrane protein YdbT with pleckstrin-like domain